ncbi:MAG: Acetolactate synthase large subunit [candidate division WS2 bacterium ADurb.Bin280]|uniref:Acetolactate synthase large subunit n=1 Tax=candidate division WS2 bacterium ADurb.Bin280 TaxID=1852829 RepID=A0A1V5SG79_9BACT|nr:MAG: Acetolactate synthase large subunit [candidate division WS2 bacterium ADurb.Bin280]
MKASDYLVKFFSQKGIDKVFGYTGGAITHIVDSLGKSDKVDFIQVYHEQTASFAAEGYSRASGKPGVAIATSGPGATNMITGIADAYFDSVATIFITGQVNTYEFKYDKPVRQQGFQETDIVEIVRPITKYATIVSQSEDLPYELEKAYQIAVSGRPGPVLLDIPMDVQRGEIKSAEKKSYQGKNKKPIFSTREFEKALAKSFRPIILAGGGVINARAQEPLEAFFKKNNLPVVVSLMGKGAVDESSSNFLGMIGTYGNRLANMALQKADLVLAIGSRLDTRQTGTNLATFAEKGKIFHIDIDSNELRHHRLKKRKRICADAKDVLQKLAVKNFKLELDEWRKNIKELKDKYSQDVDIDHNVINKLPYQLMAQINAAKIKNVIYCVDIGQNQMFAAQSLKVLKNQVFMTSGGMAPMGYAIPCAIGASVANLKRPVVAICGDGGFVFSLQALMLLKQYKLPLKIIILNNYSLGMIVQFQDAYFEGKHFATIADGGYMIPDFKGIAKSYGLSYSKFSKSSLKSNQFNKILRSAGPAIIEVQTKEKTTVVPKLLMNQPLDKMDPQILDNK